MRATWLAAIVVAASPAVSLASLTLGNTTGAMTDGNLTVTVNYDVFAPNAFPVGGEFLTSFGGAAPDLTTNWVYAYEIVNSSASTVSVSAFNIGVEGTVTNLGEDDDNGGTSPGFAFVDAGPPQSALFSFTTAISPGSSSTVLLIASPRPPSTSDSNIENGGFAISNTLPSPVPAPGAAVLALMGIGMARRFGRRSA